jgi:hypothetical protein
VTNHRLLGPGLQAASTPTTPRPEDVRVRGPRRARSSSIRKSLSYIDGTELDFVREGLNEGFRFNNPNVKRRVRLRRELQCLRP